jgi:uncharacterized protein (DUF983 family)
MSDPNGGGWNPPGGPSFGPAGPGQPPPNYGPGGYGQGQPPPNYGPGGYGQGQPPPNYGQSQPPPAYGPGGYGPGPAGYGQGPSGYGPGYGPGAYGSMPAPQMPTPVNPADAPAPVKRAVMLMLTEAVLGLIGIVISIASIGTLKSTLRADNPGYDTNKINSLATTAVAVIAVVGIVILVLYVLLALQVRKGKNWARIVTWVLAGLSVLFELISLGGDTSTTLNKVFAVLGMIINVAIIVLLARGGAYFRRRTA